MAQASQKHNAPDKSPKHGQGCGVFDGSSRMDNDRIKDDPEVEVKALQAKGLQVAAEGVVTSTHCIRISEMVVGRW